jgi:choline-glycine betaine transporter
VLFVAILTALTIIFIQKGLSNIRGIDTLSSFAIYLAAIVVIVLLQLKSDSSLLLR